MSELKVVDDGRKEEAKRVKPGKDGKVARCGQPNLQVEDAAADFRPGKLFLVVSAMSIS
jgi:hypothetical protein